ncbi:hypothetical protein MMC26_005892 [Xylographa opegraphella]|nr:hypothetical protein [Xylographa opegraphella]
MAPMVLGLRLWQSLARTEDQPIISARTAAALSITYTALYVLPFYLSSLTRPSPDLPRDSPSVIRARVRLVTLSCTICSVITICILSFHAHVPRLRILKLLGWYPIDIAGTAKPLLLTALLFAGPLFEKGVVEGRWKEWMRGRRLYECLNSWIGWRNYVAGPFTEELLFRSLLLPVAFLGQPNPSASKLRLILLTPLYFGIAHIHHFYEFKLTHPRTPLLPTLLMTLFQFAYTTVFGWYAAFVFLRTGSLWSVVLCHAFCNWMGLPRLWGKVGRTAARELGGSRRADQLMDATVLAERSGDQGAVSGRSQPRRNGNLPQPRGADRHWRWEVAWTAAYYTVLLSGVLAFWKGFWALTRSEAGLVDWDGR